MSTENETWLIETGDAVIGKQASRGLSSLSPIERVVYAFWAIDYSVRNSGTLHEAKGLYPAALEELNEFAQTNQCAQLLRICSWDHEADEGNFIRRFYALFDLACVEVRNLYEAT